MDIIIAFARSKQKLDIFFLKETCQIMDEEPKWKECIQSNYFTIVSLLLNKSCQRL
jgi:hypothetical protein